MNQLEWLEFCRENGICPTCGKPLPEGEAVGSGRLEDGAYCSVKCYALSVEWPQRRQSG